MRKILSKVRRTLRPIRGKGFVGGGRQKLRSKQIEEIRSIFPNETFLSRYPELLAQNESRTTVADKIDVSDVLQRYHRDMADWHNYPVQVQGLEGWISSQGDAWPRIHPMHQRIVDAFKRLGPASVCEVGAGAGVVAKYVYAASDRKVRLTCVEGSQTHLAAMRQNFASSSIIPPQIQVDADIVVAPAQNLPFSDRSIEMVYTCTVMLHLPFIPAVLAAAEFSRVASRYILHVEGCHTDGIPKPYRGPYDTLMIDYEALYDRLGFKTLEKSYHKDPYSDDYDYVVFLAERR